MGLLNKLGLAIGAQTARSTSAALPTERNTRNSQGPAVAVGTNRAPELQEASRVSNGLKEFHGRMAWAAAPCWIRGPACRPRLHFFIERGFRVTSDDILHDWSQFLADHEAKTKQIDTPETYTESTPAARAKRFLEENLHIAASFDALLLWDVLDYLEPALAKLVISQLTDLLRPGGAVFAMFHSKKPAGFQRYRVADTSTLQVLSAKSIFPAQ